MIEKFSICDEVSCFDGRIIGTCERPHVGQELFLSCSTNSPSEPTSLGTITHIVESSLPDYDLCVHVNTGKSYYLSKA